MFFIALLASPNPVFKGKLLVSKSGGFLKFNKTDLIIHLLVAPEQKKKP
jgi:hypothetical protein